MPIAYHGRVPAGIATYGTAPGARSGSSRRDPQRRSRDRLDTVAAIPSERWKRTEPLPCPRQLCVVSLRTLTICVPDAGSLNHAEAGRSPSATRAKRSPESCVRFPGCTVPRHYRGAVRRRMDPPAARHTRRLPSDRECSPPRISAPPWKTYHGLTRRAQISRRRFAPAPRAFPGAAPHGLAAPRPAAKSLAAGRSGRTKVPRRAALAGPYLPGAG